MAPRKSRKRAEKAVTENSKNWVEVSVPPLKTAPGVLVPLVAQDLTAVVKMLGGQDALEAALSEPARGLRLRFRPQDPNCHGLSARPVCGAVAPDGASKDSSGTARKKHRKRARTTSSDDLTPTPRPPVYLAMRVRRGASTESGGVFPSYVEGTSVQVYGAVQPVLTFLGQDAPLADFQFVSKHRKKGLLGEGSHEIRLPTTLDVAPKAFADDRPQVFKIGAKQAIRQQLSSTRVLFRDAIPKGPMGTEEKKSTPDRDEARSLLEFLLDRRAVWTKRSLKKYLPQVSKYQLDAVLREETFTYVQGPWVFCQVKFGFDPKIEALGRFFQPIRIRLSVERLKTYKSIFKKTKEAFCEAPKEDPEAKAPKDGENDQNADPNTPVEGLMDKIQTSFKSTIVEMLCGAQPTYMGVDLTSNMLIPLIDVTEEEFQKRLLSSYWNDTCDEQFGWWSPRQIKDFTSYVASHLESCFSKMKSMIEVAERMLLESSTEEQSVLSGELDGAGQLVPQTKPRVYEEGIPEDGQPMSIFDFLDTAKTLTKPKNLAEIYRAEQHSPNDQRIGIHDPAIEDNVAGVVEIPSLSKGGLFDSLDAFDLLGEDDDDEQDEDDEDGDEDATQEGVEIDVMEEANPHTAAI